MVLCFEQELSICVFCILRNGARWGLLDPLPTDCGIPSAAGGVPPGNTKER